MGSNRKDTYTYEITVKNNRTTGVNLSLYDQIPISQNSDIAVTVNEVSGAVYDELTGKLYWPTNLAAGQSKTVRLSFTIKYPKDKQIQVKSFRTISCPAF